MVESRLVQEKLDNVNALNIPNTSTYNKNVSTKLHKRLLQVPKWRTRQVIPPFYLRQNEATRRGKGFWLQAMKPRVASCTPSGLRVGWGWRARREQETWGKNSELLLSKVSPGGVICAVAPRNQLEGWPWSPFPWVMGTLLHHGTEEFGGWMREED